MIIFPAIDIKNGACVRLQQGDFTTSTTYRDNPVQVAQEYERDGASWIHIIDLDGAETGNNTNILVIKDIVEQTSIKIQVGGGIRSEETIRTLLDIGVTRVIVGTFALKQPQALQRLLVDYPNQIIVSVDSKDGFVTYHGWQEQSTKTTLSFSKELEALGVQTIVYTDIAKDGMMQGPNINDYQTLQQQTSLNIIASGGVSTYDDINTLRELGLYGAIIGKALYIKQLNLKEAIRCSQNESFPV
ncbi:1-(5-phosphoribosyl)-5-[(5-phosphoribosylamino)methylideneamino]imidazole-4-carboxamide isomerase [Candidatus Xianfuyuplasma coldseepsis]|uniref:1-(5-phosphoribosyl)-5-[(5-phosphoribosylamino)methylideneamino] imidazole-4-carboxamide isomerase n=1 Tax=Candidatus Xianfuyuplasma coldseepsis TaxID=2782163 RepID=A0A7L7KS61_9MOLU|nr:1-(5-phosphoribosyl)-5-[(5-phosphoribosylamino)methylideneamino]imidazole-4-carboxamide isomerase [Xianfuyuplasma coldseepsis]QMS84784.1 1-(5-phosphoribosyl)-5-[(5-phosphoribosylamino)methylideneamino]imidazole-4-carboxamide isomerase [Xianfuyuplasma coldseepsis]